MMRAALAPLAALAAASLTPILMIGGPVAPQHWPGLVLAALFFAFPVALLHAAVIAAPIYVLMMILRWPVSWVSAALVGVATGAAPLGALTIWLVLTLLMGKGPDLVVNSLMMELGAASGLVGGLVFRAVHGPGLGLVKGARA